MFEQLLLALKNRVCPEFTVFNMYFYHSEFSTSCACLEKQNLPWNFSLYWNIFIFQNFWATWACPENRVCPEFFKPWGRPRTPLVSRHTHNAIKTVSS